MMRCSLGWCGITPFPLRGWEEWILHLLKSLHWCSFGWCGIIPFPLCGWESGHSTYSSFCIIIYSDFIYVDFQFPNRLNVRDIRSKDTCWSDPHWYKVTRGNPYLSMVEWSKTKIDYMLEWSVTKISYMLEQFVTKIGYMLERFASTQGNIMEWSTLIHVGTIHGVIHNNACWRNPI